MRLRRHLNKLKYILLEFKSGNGLKIILENFKLNN